MLTTFLYQAIEDSGNRSLPAFAEMIVLTTLCWHGVTFHRITPDTDTNSSVASFFWKRHARLYQMVQQRLMLLSLPASSPELHDPMRLFTNMLANAAVIWFHNILETFQVDVDEQMLLVPLCSAYEIVALAKPLIRSSFFKVRITIHWPVWIVSDKVNRRIRSLPCYCIWRQSFFGVTPSVPLCRRINTSE